MLPWWSGCTWPNIKIYYPPADLSAPSTPNPDVKQVSVLTNVDHKKIIYNDIVITFNDTRNQNVRLLCKYYLNKVIYIRTSSCFDCCLLSSVVAQQTKESLFVWPFLRLTESERRRRRSLLLYVYLSISMICGLPKMLS